MISIQTLISAFACFVLYVLAYVFIDQVLANLGHMFFLFTFAFGVLDIHETWGG